MVFQAIQRNVQMPGLLAMLAIAAYMCRSTCRNSYLLR